MKKLKELEPGQVVMDNLPAHKSPRIRRLIESAGTKLLLLPAYSPDYNPIEMAISKIKTLLREIAGRTVDAVSAAIGNAVKSITPNDVISVRISFSGMPARLVTRHEPRLALMRKCRLVSITALGKLLAEAPTSLTAENACGRFRNRFGHNHRFQFSEDHWFMPKFVAERQCVSVRLRMANGATLLIASRRI